MANVIHYIAPDGNVKAATPTREGKGFTTSTSSAVPSVTPPPAQTGKTATKTTAAQERAATKKVLGQSNKVAGGQNKEEKTTAELVTAGVKTKTRRVTHPSPAQTGPKIVQSGAGVKARSTIQKVQKKSIYKTI